jgi:NADP-dependent 3-hydroxy acid dehydrogenase YdfG
MRWAATPEMDPNLAIRSESIAETIWFLANLPRGTTTAEIIVQSELYQ